MACTIMWRKQSRAAVVVAPLCSTLAAAVAWFGTAYTHYGAVTIETTSRPLPLVAGNMMSICGPMVLTPLITYIKPDDFDWAVFKQIKSDAGGGSLEELQQQSSKHQQQRQQRQRGNDDDNNNNNNESHGAATAAQVVAVTETSEKADDEQEEEEVEEEEEAQQRRHDDQVNARLLVARKKAAICCVALCLSFCILWPIPMYGSNYGE
ncbi:urea active transporter [Diplodia seriata]